MYQYIGYMKLFLKKMHLIIKEENKNLLLIVFSFSYTTKLFAWTSTSSVVSIFFKSLYGILFNLLSNVVFPAPPHPTIMHLTRRMGSFSFRLRNFFNFFSSIWCFVLSLNEMQIAGKQFVYIDHTMQCSSITMETLSKLTCFPPLCDTTTIMKELTSIKLAVDITW